MVTLNQNKLNSSASYGFTEKHCLQKYHFRTYIIFMLCCRGFYTVELLLYSGNFLN